jgi:hypothetical protein
MIDEDESYFWKDRQRQLDPDSRRAFEWIVGALIAGFVVLVIVLVAA